MDNTRTFTCSGCGDAVIGEGPENNLRPEDWLIREHAAFCPDCQYVADGEEEGFEQQHDATVLALQGEELRWQRIAMTKLHSAVDAIADRQIAKASTLLLEAHDGITSSLAINEAIAALGEPRRVPAEDPA